MGGSSRALPFPTAVGLACSSEGISTTPSPSNMMPTCEAWRSNAGELSNRRVDDDPADSKASANRSTSGRTLPDSGIDMGSDELGWETPLPFASTVLMVVVELSGGERSWA